MNRKYSSILYYLAFFSVKECDAVPSPEKILRGTDFPDGGQPPATSTANLSREVCPLESKVLQDVGMALAQEDLYSSDINVPFKGLDDVESAIADFSASSLENQAGRLGWNCLVGIARSETFARDFWHKRPLLIRSKDIGGWVKGAFTVEKDLRLVDGSFITGYKTAEILRNGTKTDTWALSPLKDNPARKTTWSDIAYALEGGTIYFNTAGSLWKNLGGLCRLTAYAFGLPSNVNVYVTPPGCNISVPPHTDKQDVFVFQTQGAKRWRVWSSPPRVEGRDPLARGKAGDVLSYEEMGSPLIDTVIQPGDFLYVPLGFPHTTDTSNPVDEGLDDSIFSEHSVHLTMGLDTHVWCLCMAHLRWTLLQRCNKAFKVDIKDDPTYWKAIESIPIGFLGGKAWRSTIASMNDGKGIGENLKAIIAKQLRNVLVSMEPGRWNEKGSSECNENENLPTKEEVDEVSEFYVAKHWMELISTQDKLFRDVDSTSEESLLKAFRGTQEQELIMEELGVFSKNTGFAESFRSRRLAKERRAKNASI